MADRGELIGIEDQRIRFDRQIADAIHHDVEGEIAIATSLRVGRGRCRRACFLSERGSLACRGQAGRAVRECRKTQQTPFWYHKQFFAEAGRFLGNPFLKIAAFLKPEFPKGPRCQRRDRICFGVNLELRSYTPPCGRTTMR